MDVLYPSLINIEGRIYCDYNSSHGHKVDEESFDDVLEETEDYETNDKNITTRSNGMFETTINTASALFKYIIGTKGATKRTLEFETRTRIEIPRRGTEGNIVISGKDKSGVASARNRIELIVSEKRWKQQFTHFVSIPLVNEEVKESFHEFEEDVMMKFSSSRGVCRSIFQIPTKLHLTICTLTLLNEIEVEKAKEVLMECGGRVVDVLEGTSLNIALKGLEYMNDDPANVDVLYGKVQSSDGSDKLQAIANLLDETFTNAGLSEKQYDRVKLHATLLNTTFRKVESRQATRGGSRQRESFDATKILAAFGNFNFGKVKVDKIHMSERMTTDKNGYYFPTATIALPQ
uniref:Activating signal cointegrator 1 complex subunit 1-like n=1 Tax=Ciona intestinalis TaxID=7719 RepID=F6YCI4_CIOIN|nr:activating signal cointegrator 1 complex subunit 1-like [Ciona intestinalis]|eukprot:XP_002129758.1 activating signal cointegrator 1 complex subunit 1-like [Ciona intestinalis]